MISLLPAHKTVHFTVKSPPSLVTYFAGGIVDPCGPTLVAVARDRQAGSDGHSPVYQFNTNPFGQGYWQVATYRQGGDSEADIRALRPVLADECCPTLMYAPAMIEWNRAPHVLAGWIEGFRDSARTLARVEAFCGDPWNRVSSEIEAAVAGPGAPTQRGPCGPDRALRLGNLLLSQEHQEPERLAFCAAWAGSIEHAGPIARALLRPKPLAEFTTWLVCLAYTCYRPHHRWVAPVGVPIPATDGAGGGTRR